MGCNARCGVNCGRYQWCDLKYGIANWKCAARGAGDMVRNDGVTWNVVWFGIMSEMVSV